MSNGRMVPFLLSMSNRCTERKLPPYDKESQHFHHRPLSESLAASVFIGPSIQTKGNPESQPPPVSELCVGLPFLQDYKVVKRTARTRAPWKVFLLEVKRQCRALHSEFLCGVCFPLTAADNGLF